MIRLLQREQRETSPWIAGYRRSTHQRWSTEIRWPLSVTLMHRAVRLFDFLLRRMETCLLWSLNLRCYECVDRIFPHRHLDLGSAEAGERPKPLDPASDENHEDSGSGNGWTGSTGI